MRFSSDYAIFWKLAHVVETLFGKLVFTAGPVSQQLITTHRTYWGG